MRRVPPTMAHPASWNTEKLLAECDSRRQRRSGPGGQHRNKVETAVVIVHRGTAIKGEATERRSQEQNRRMALFRLRVNLALGLRCPRDTETGAPSELWCRRCHGGRLSINAGHDEFPAMLAEALDVLQEHEMDVKRSVAWLGCTASQLVRFLKLERRALLQVNQQRRERGLRPLR